MTPMLLPVWLAAVGTVAPWGPGVFEEAQRAQRPVLLIVGDTACSRCALDESEALADEATAQLLQRSFVVTRIERYERPELDDLYGTAVTWLGGRRLYPLAVALLPDGRPFAGHGGWSAEDRGDAPSLRRHALRAWSEFTHQRAEADARAARAVEALAQAQRTQPAPLDAQPAAPALKGLEQAFDRRTGGFGDGEAFAPPAARRLLLAVLERGEDARARRLLEPMLDALLAVEPETIAQRALLIETFARAHALVGRPAHAQKVATLVEGALRQRDAAGAFTPAPPGWNGLMIGALALSGSILDRPPDVEAARAAAAAVLGRLGPPAGWRRGDGTPALLEDYAYLAEGLLRLDAVVGARERRWVEEAAVVADAALGRYADAEGDGFFDALPGSAPYVPPTLPSRLRNGYDTALPSANGVMAGVLMRLAQAAAQPRYAELGRRTVEAFGGALQRAPRGMEGMAAAALQLAAPADVGPETVADAPLPSRAERSGVQVAAEVMPSRLPVGQPASLRVRLAVPAGVHVVAHDPGTAELVGLSASVPASGASAAGAASYPTSRVLEGRWGSGRVNVHEGQVEVVLPLSLAAAATPGPRRVRVRVVFQVCREAAAVCDRPEAVVLDAPFEAAPAR